MRALSDTVQRSVKPATGILIGFAIIAAVIAFAFSVLAGYAVGRSLAVEDAGVVQTGRR
jgi:hypothetical protein